MKKAFTMMEIIIVIVIIGILAAVVVPRTGSNKAAEAAVKLIADIRYAQHLAMVDDKFSSTTANWYENIWQVRFSGNKYSVVSDDGARFAKRTINDGESMQDKDINADYGVALSFSGSCAADAIIGFDHVGRPILGDLSGTSSPYTNLMTADCVIKLSGGGEDVDITIRPETGYASLPSVP